MYNHCKERRNRIIVAVLYERTMSLSLHFFFLLLPPVEGWWPLHRLFWVHILLFILLKWVSQYSVICGGQRHLEHSYSFIIQGVLSLETNINLVSELWTNASSKFTAYKIHSLQKKMLPWFSVDGSFRNYLHLSASLCIFPLQPFPWRFVMRRFVIYPHSVHWRW